MFNKIVKCFFLLFLFFSFLNTSFAEINLVVTPIKYELKLNPGETITKTVTLRNKWTWSLYITTWKTNVINKTDTYEPIFVKEWNPNQELASWITLEQSNFNISWLSDYILNFSITVPKNATPWWHYWAVFFEYDSKSNKESKSQENAINVKANYWLLILVEVSWKIIEWWKAGNIIIDKKYPWIINISKNFQNKEEEINSELNSAPIHPKDKIDNCKFWDFSPSNYDSKCFDELSIKKIIDYISNKKIQEKDNSEIIDNKIWENNIPPINKEDDNFQIDFNVPFENNGNTHIKPSWKITFYDEEDKQIKWIWIEIITDINWNKIGEKIIDYIPINPENSNILPETKRTFFYEWKWFPYQINDENWEIVTKYKTPKEYYNSNSKNTQTIYPWQKTYIELAWRKIKAITNIAYTKSNWEVVEFNSAEEFFIEYETEKVWYDQYYIIIILLFVALIFILYLIVLTFRKKRCKKCRKFIKKNLKICPYCLGRQTTNKK